MCNVRGHKKDSVGVLVLIVTCRDMKRSPDSGRVTVTGVKRMVSLATTGVAPNILDITAAVISFSSDLLP